MRHLSYWVLIFSIVSLTALAPTNLAAKNSSKNISANNELVRQSYRFEKDKKYLSSLKVFLKYKSYNQYFFNLRLGWLYYLNLRIGNALTHYNKAIGYAPKSIDAYLGLVNCYIYTKKYSTAKSILEKALKWAPTNVSLLEKLALVNYYQGNKKEQLITVQKLLRYYPTSTIYLNQAALISKELGNKKNHAYYLALSTAILPRSYLMESVAPTKK